MDDNKEMYYESYIKNVLPYDLVLFCNIIIDIVVKNYAKRRGGK